MSKNVELMPERLADQITPLVITFNEAPNLKRCLDKLTWARQVLVLDSGSTDETLAIARSFANVAIVTRPFDSFARQCNFGLDQITSDWVLSMDCDYELSDALVQEIQALKVDETAAFEVSFIYRIYGRPLRATLYPARIALYRRAKARYHDEGHAHRVTIDGPVGKLRNRIFHDDRKPLARWMGSQQRYAKNEADYLLGTPVSKLGRIDRLRRMGWPAPILVFFYTLIWKGCLLDGLAGWFYTLQRLAAETMICLEIVDRKLQRATQARDASTSKPTDAHGR